MNEFNNFCGGVSNDCNPAFPQQATKWKKGIYSTYQIENDDPNENDGTFEAAIPDTDFPETVPAEKPLVKKKKKKSKALIKPEDSATDKTDDKNSSQPAKNKTVPFSVGQKKIIMNVFKYFRTECGDVNVSEAVRRTSRATGCAERTVYSIRKEEQSEHGLQQSKSRRVKRPIWKLKYGDDVRNAVRTVIYDLKARNVIPSIKEIQQNIKTVLNINMARSSLWVLIKEMGFVYVRKKGKEHILVEKVVELDVSGKKKVKRERKSPGTSGPKLKKTKSTVDVNTPPTIIASTMPQQALVSTQLPQQQQQQQQQLQQQQQPPPPPPGPLPQPPPLNSNLPYGYLKNGSFYDDGYNFP